MRKIWDIPGGVHPPENKQQSNHCPIASIALPKQIILPLNQHIGSPAIATVTVGDKVQKGQEIAKAQGLVSAPVHASTSGTVIEIGDRFIPHPSGMTAPCIVIEPDGQEQWAKLEPCEDYQSIKPVDLVEKIRNAGIAGMGGAGFPAAVKLSPRADNKINTLILNGTECEPYITADDMLMRERSGDIIQGALLLAYILGQPENILIGIEDNKPEAIASMTKAAEGTAVNIVSFPTKYPSGGEKQLIQIVTGQEVPSGSIPAQLGIVVQNVGSALAAYRAVCFGEPLISRITTVVGESLQQQRNIEVLLGTPVEHILNEHGFQPEKCARLIIGGPMMGYTVEQSEVPVVKTTNCVLVPSTGEMPAQPPAQPCIRCGMCAEACPANLLPQQLFWYSQSEDIDNLKSHNLFDCIECGACSFVCPSNIPLVQYYRASKGTIRHIETEKQKSDRSRQRFEFRQERIAKAEAEKEAKRLARKKAAEEAKKQLAEKKANGEQDSKTPAAKKNVVSAAVDNAKAQQDDPAKQRAKLERALSSAESRVERAEKQLAESREEGDQARVDTLEARLKQAELKVKEAKDKLAAFETSAETASPADNSSAAKADVGEKSIRKKVSQSPLEQQQKTVDTLKKRIATAEQKYAEAQQAGASTTDALANGVEKLKAKLVDAEKALAEQQQADPSPAKQTEQDKTVSAAELAIEKAKAKAAALANMSDEEKAKAQVESLKKRLDKARQRLDKAVAENNDNVDAFKTSVEKLEAKLQEAEAGV